MGCHITQYLSEHPDEVLAEMMGRTLYRPYEEDSDVHEAVLDGWRALMDGDEDEEPPTGPSRITRQCRSMIDRLVAALATHDEKALAEGIATAQILEMSLPEIADPEES